ncbi:ssDNA-binding transcriptional regulator [Arabidopsis thaliana x Arabidopsis arenosa]|uniref:SsDNA-binding transcriptional regulator n=1 Tax=Arabidopsis thaliana x Arabidopsis arenosa TaxID=1240361 RepID=A0A8T1Z1H3_9BRAS|nr:ssDNA-binding transcriptional regulator [Arabidopsis thaliana x Arabidopsis arenosa]KAG7552697.1 ssDNA-binding transcriptional regulator [Arabidopsis thaliana x Arabidopsis arenosa]
MEKETKEKIEKTVREILNESDMKEMTEFKVRQLASERIGIDLSEKSHKAFVRSVVEKFLHEERAREYEKSKVNKEEEEEEEDGDKDCGKGRNKEFDDDGDLIICRLSDKRRVTIQEFKGKTLVSIREYYKKDGKELPTSKGISLTDEQWSTFKKNIPAIENAVKKMESRV